MRKRARSLLASTCVALASCHAPMSMLSATSESAGRVVKLTQFMLVLTLIIFSIVLVVLGMAVRRNRARASASVDLTPHDDRWIIVCGIVLPACILAAVFIVSLRAMGRPPTQAPALTISVVGQQWWWRVRYHPERANVAFNTANEIHIPVGQQVRLLLTSNDVIHSFWVPQLQGKLDVIPGDTNDLRLSASRPGVYYGKCAEFCGAQHANMAIVVVAQDSATFAEWERQQLADANAAFDSSSKEGEQLFAAAPCVACHTVRGTTAAGTAGPDLTHVASRLSIGAGVVPMRPGSLAGWIANAPSIKPGVHMPRLTGYSGEELRAIAHYVAGLR
jgi:cytochrome c oxidase subunit 2